MRLNLLCSLALTGFNSCLAKVKTYPEVKRADINFTYPSQLRGSVSVPDPYHFLEASLTDSEDVQKFVAAQNAYTQKYIDQTTNAEAINEVFDAVFNHTQFGTPHAEGPYDDPTYYYSEKSVTDDHWTWYAAKYVDLIKAENDQYVTLPGRKFADKSGISNLIFSPLANWVAYTASSSQSTHTVKIHSTSELLAESTDDAEVLNNVVSGKQDFKVAWGPDDKGIFYQRYENNQDTGAQLWYHAIGTKQADDILVIDKDPGNPSVEWDVDISDDDNYLICKGMAADNSGLRTYLAPLNQPISSNMRWLSIAPSFAYEIDFLANYDTLFYLYSTKDAPNGKVVTAQIDPSKAKIVTHVSELQDEAVYTDVIKEDPILQMDHVSVINEDKLLIAFLTEGRHEIFQYELKTGTVVQRLWPEFLGVVCRITGGRGDREAFLGLWSLSQPYTNYRLQWTDEGKDPRAEPIVHLHRSTTSDKMDFYALESRIVYVTSEGDVKVPVYLVYQKGQTLDGTGPAAIWSYGASDVGSTTTYDQVFHTWLTAFGGVYAFVVARGGAGVGVDDEWHKAGMLFNKKNSFYDLMSVAQYLADENLAAKGKIVLAGVWNAGSLATLAVANMAPEGLLGYVWADRPLADMLRLPQFPEAQQWLGEFGDASKDGAIFDYIYTYDPLRNIDASKMYPPVLISVTNGDQYSCTAHAFKMIAQLQHELPFNPNPFLLYQDLIFNGDDQEWRLEALRFCLTSSALGLQVLPLPKKLY